MNDIILVLKVLDGILVCYFLYTILSYILNNKNS